MDIPENIYFDHEGVKVRKVSRIRIKAESIYLTKENKISFIRGQFNNVFEFTPKQFDALVNFLLTLKAGDK